LSFLKVLSLIKCQHNCKTRFVWVNGSGKNTCVDKVSHNAISKEFFKFIFVKGWGAQAHTCKYNDILINLFPVYYQGFSIICFAQDRLKVMNPNVLFCAMHCLKNFTMGNP
jgi:hypothetical protein